MWPTRQVREWGHVPTITRAPLHARIKVQPSLHHFRVGAASSAHAAGRTLGDQRKIWSDGQAEK